MTNIISKVVHDGERTVYVKVSGWVDCPTLEDDSRLAQLVIPLEQLKQPPKLFRIDTIQFAVEDKLCCNLWWDNEGDLKPDSFITPIQGRGRYDYEWFFGEHNPKADGHTGNLLLTFRRQELRPLGFSILFDLMTMGA